MKGSKISVAVAVVVVALTGVFAGTASAGGRPQGMSVGAYQALVARSEAMNARYGLGRGSAAGAINALQIRGDAMNARYGLGTYAVVRPVAGFDWTDAAVGAAAMLGAIVAVGGVFFGTRRARAASFGTA